MSLAFCVPLITEKICSFADPESVLHILSICRSTYYDDLLWDRVSYRRLRIIHRAVKLEKITVKQPEHVDRRLWLAILVALWDERTNLHLRTAFEGYPGDNYAFEDSVSNLKLCSGNQVDKLVIIDEYRNRYPKQKTTQSSPEKLARVRYMALHLAYGALLLNNMVHGWKLNTQAGESDNFHHTCPDNTKIHFRYPARVMATYEIEEELTAVLQIPLLNMKLLMILATPDIAYGPGTHIDLSTHPFSLWISSMMEVLTFSTIYTVDNHINGPSVKQEGGCLPQAAEADHVFDWKNVEEGTADSRYWSV